MVDVTVGKDLDKDVTKAYIAGFLDGDGAITAVIEPHAGKKFRFRVRVAMDFYQHKDNVKLLLYLKKVFGEGSLGRSIRDTHKLSLRNQATLKNVLPLLYPFSRIKRNQIRIAMRIVRTAIRGENDLHKVARLADELSSHNVRSKGRRKNFSTMIVSSSRND